MKKGKVFVSVFLVLVMLAVFATITAATSAENGINAEEVVAFTINDTDIVVRKTGDISYTATYVDGILFETAVGTLNKIQLTAYDGQTSLPPSMSTMSGVPVETRHAEKSNIRYLGNIKQVPSIREMTRRAAGDPIVYACNLQSAVPGLCLAGHTDQNVEHICFFRPVSSAS